MPSHFKKWPAIFLLILATRNALPQRASSSCAECVEWNQPQKPFRIFGNIYYIGTHGLSSILITSDAGHVVIDGALPESADQIVANIRSLGFRIQDVKIILNSHVHFDHAGGISKLQKLSGARVIASDWSAAVLKKGGVGSGDPQRGILRPIKPVKKVQNLQDGQTVSVGEISLTAHLTPGHTPGGTSWTWKSCEGAVCENVVYADSLTPVSAGNFSFTKSTEYPSAIADFEKSFRFLETASCDILLTTHPDTSQLWERVDARRRGASPDPMIDSNACRQLAANARAQLQSRIDRETKKKE